MLIRRPEYSATEYARLEPPAAAAAAAYVRAEPLLSPESWLASTNFRYEMGYFCEFIHLILVIFHTTYEPFLYAASHTTWATHVLESGCSLFARHVHMAALFGLARKPHFSVACVARAAAVAVRVAYMCPKCELLLRSRYSCEWQYQATSKKRTVYGVVRSCAGHGEPRHTTTATCTAALRRRNRGSFSVRVRCAAHT